MGSKTAYRINEAFGTCIGDSDQVKVTPPHGLLSGRDFTFNRAQQSVTVTERKMLISQTKKLMDFSDIVLGIVNRGGPAGYCIELHHRKLGSPLRVYTLTGGSANAEDLEPVKAAIAETTGADRWEKLV